MTKNDFIDIMFSFGLAMMDALPDAGDRQRAVHRLQEMASFKDPEPEKVGLGELDGEKDAEKFISVDDVEEWIKESDPQEITNILYGTMDNIIALRKHSVRFLAIMNARSIVDVDRMIGDWRKADGV